MSKYIPGNQKHLTLDDRKYIESELNKGTSFKDIARFLCKDPTTISKEVKSRRVGGATFQVPTEIRADRKESISMKNLIIFARKRGGKSMADKLAAEIMDAFNEQGGAYKRKEDMHRMAEANRAFAHFRF